MNQRPLHFLHYSIAKIHVEYLHSRGMYNKYECVKRLFCIKEGVCFENYRWKMLRKILGDLRTS